LNFIKKNFSAVPSFLAGDPRLDQIEYRINHPKNTKDFLKPKTPAIVLGSTWSEDENQIFNLDFYKEMGLSVIIAPHELSQEHIEHIELESRYYGFTSLLYSRAEISDHDWSNQKKVLIIDQVGILPEIYRWGIMAFVGGSFKEKVHNIMEPLACGLPVIVGPYNQNSFEVQTKRGNNDIDVAE
jgi:3-deoxy-D-manno-octulosonic-acid transferase